MSKVYRAAVLEFVGMTLFVYVSAMLNFYDNVVGTNGGCAAYTTPLKNAIAASAVVGLFVYAGTGISKVTLNPCATFILMITKHISFGQGLLNILANFGGSALAGLMLYFVLGNTYGVQQHDLFMQLYQRAWNRDYQGDSIFTNESWICTESIAAFLSLVVSLYANYNFQKEPATKSFLSATAFFLPFVSIYQLTGAGIHPAHYFGIALVNGIFFNLPLRVYMLGSAIGVVFALPLTWYLFLGREFKGMFGITSSDAQVLSPEVEHTSD